MPYIAKTVRTALNKAQRLLSTDPAESLRIAEALLDRLKAYPLLKADTLGMVGLARQFTGNREGALTAFRKALALETRPLRQGYVYCRWGLLDIERHKLNDALEKVTKGYSLIVRTGPSNKKDWAYGLVARGVCYWHHGRYAEAEADHGLALGDYIHPRKDAKLHYAAVQNLSLCYIYGTGGLERITRALDALRAGEQTLRRHRIPMTSMQGGMLLWTRGIVLRFVGALERTKHLYHRSQQIFEKIGATTEWLRVSLDLGEIYLDNGKWGKLRQLVCDMLEIADDIETIAALNLYCRALEQKNLTEQVLRKVYRTIHGESRRIPLITPQLDEFDEPIGF